jgi:hypothetical protein
MVENYMPTYKYPHNPKVNGSFEPLLPAVIMAGSRGAFSTIRRRIACVKVLGCDDIAAWWYGIQAWEDARVDSDGWIGCSDLSLRLAGVSKPARCIARDGNGQCFHRMRSLLFQCFDHDICMPPGRLNRFVVAIPWGC